jgi:hypothetical protein
MKKLRERFVLNLYNIDFILNINNINLNLE